MQFSFAAPNNILFGAGSIAQAATEAATLGTRALLVVGRNPDRAVDVQRRLASAGMEVILFAIAGEPEIAQVVEGAARARQARCDLVVGMGGGSVLDGAKAIAALATNTDPIETYLEVIGAGRALLHAPLPCIAIPTTSGTGSEVTRNAVLKSTLHKVKVSLRSPRMLPVLAAVDPELTLTLPPAVTAATGCAVGQGQPAYRWPVSGRLGPCRQSAAAGSGSRWRSCGANGYGVGQSLQRPCAGKCGPGCSPRHCRPSGRNDRCSTRRAVRPVAALCGRSQLACLVA